MLNQIKMVFSGYSKLNFKGIGGNLRKRKKMAYDEQENLKRLKIELKKLDKYGDPLLKTKKKREPGKVYYVKSDKNDYLWIFEAELKEETENEQ